MRLVKPAAAKRRPATRSWASACEETSITTSRVPASRISPSSACTAVDSGVVWAAGRSTPGNRCVTVPITPVGRPAARAQASTR